MGQKQNKGIKQRESRVFEKDLNMLITHFDKNLEKLWEAKQDSQQFGLVGSLLKAPFKETKVLFSMFKGTKFSFLPILNMGIVSSVLGYFGFNNELFISTFGKTEGNIIIMIFIVIFWYITTVVMHYFEMAKLDSPFFHYSAFARLRKPEYEMFKHLNGGGQAFQFQPMKDWLYDPLRHVEIARIQKKNEELMESFSEFQEIFMQTKEEKNQEILILKENLETNIALLKSITRKIERISNNTFSGNDLGLDCPYTLYKKEGAILNLLVKVEHQEMVIALS